MELNPFSFARMEAQALINLTQGLKKLVAKHLWAKILFGLFLGLAVGLLLSPNLNLVSPRMAEVTTSWLALPGQLFLSLVQMVVIPLVFASVVRGVAAGDSIEQLKSLGLKVGLYYLFTTIVAVSIGLAIASAIQPGRHMDKETVSKMLPQDSKQSGPDVTNGITTPSLKEIIPSLIPQNPLGAIVGGEMLQIVLLALFMGIALMSLREDVARPLLELLNSLQQVSMVVIHWAMYLAPIAVFGLMTRLMYQVGLDALLGLGIYVGTVLLGLALVMVFYMVLLTFMSHQNPWNFLGQIREVQLLAFSTSSSAAVMPLTIETAQKKLGIRPSIAQFLIPLGTTINMDGTALYQGVATVFLAQIFQIDLSFGQMILVVVTATAASIGAPGTPGVGIVVLSMILSSIGVPPSGIVLIMGVDRVLDMCRTIINVSGDLTAASIMDRLVPKIQESGQRSPKNS
ncbi:MAG: dicarboxylate/amino acid:cation symporter [Bdellovibrionaceae bacterium]|nr:dicarboxylate/amino acid:cation symporter [Bdellovibrionales bacterium]MCB9083400.1 dicarboxylate/amino acid:cation symporter [Pseudobdellovibrionaceae bacterium]